MDKIAIEAKLNGEIVVLHVLDLDGFFHASEDSYLFAYSQVTGQIIKCQKKDLKDLSIII